MTNVWVNGVPTVLFLVAGLPGNDELGERLELARIDDATQEEQPTERTHCTIGTRHEDKSRTRTRRNRPQPPAQGAPPDEEGEEPPGQYIGAPVLLDKEGRNADQEGDEDRSSPQGWDTGSDHEPHN